MLRSQSPTLTQTAPATPCGRCVRPSVPTMAEQFTTGMATSPVTAGEKSFPPLDPETFVPQLVWLVLTFGLLYVLLKRFALPRVGEVIEERQNCIQRDLEQAAALKAETEQALANNEQAQIEARGRAHAVATDMSDKLAAEIHKERTKFDAQI